MRAFANLFDTLDRTTSLLAKEAALAAYFRKAPPADAAWAAYLLTGRKLKRLLPSSALRLWAREEATLPEWLFEESYHAVGDLAETIALLLKPADSELGASRTLAPVIEEDIAPLRGLDPTLQRERVVGLWRVSTKTEIFLINKFLTGSFRVGVAQGLVIKGVAKAIGIDAQRVAEALAGDWVPTPAFWRELSEESAADGAKPRLYPFFLASPLEGGPETLGEPTEWRAEWKWDGIRGQLVRREGSTLLWSRGEELIATSFPEIVAAADALPLNTVLDGEILAFDRDASASGQQGAPRAFSSLQKRLGRRAPSAKIRKDHPVVFMVYDALEHAGQDLRSTPLDERRLIAEAVVQAARQTDGETPILISPRIPYASWEDLARLREESRSRNVEGLILKHAKSPYLSGRRRGHWWKWKIDPLTVDAVLLYAQAGHGRRASLYTDYTFAVWSGDALVPVAKAYSGLTDEEIAEVDAWIRRHTREKFGPVRSVDPLLVFELGFEGIAASTRHKSGVALRFPRMLRWRRDKTAAQADTLESLQRLIAEHAAAGQTLGPEGS